MPLPNIYPGLTTAVDVTSSKGSGGASPTDLSTYPFWYIFGLDGDPIVASNAVSDVGSDGDSHGWNVVFDGSLLHISVPSDAVLTFGHRFRVIITWEGPDDDPRLDLPPSDVSLPFFFQDFLPGDLSTIWVPPSGFTPPPGWSAGDPPPGWTPGEPAPPGWFPPGEYSSGCPMLLDPTSAGVKCGESTPDFGTIEGDFSASSNNISIVDGIVVLSEGGRSIGDTGRTGFNILTGEDCSFTITTLDDWITTYPTSGTGNTEVIISYLANAGAARVGVITVHFDGGEEIFTLYQEGCCSDCCNIQQREIKTTEFFDGIRLHDNIAGDRLSGYAVIRHKGDAQDAGTLARIDAGSNLVPMNHILGTFQVFNTDVRYSVWASNTSDPIESERTYFYDRIFSGEGYFQVNAHLADSFFRYWFAEIRHDSHYNNDSISQFTDLRLYDVNGNEICVLSDPPISPSLPAPDTCSYVISPNSASYSFRESFGIVSARTETGCYVVAVSNDSWITIQYGSSFAGSGYVGYKVSQNSGSARTGTITISGRTFTVYQEALSTPVYAPYPAVNYPQFDGYVYNGNFGDMTEEISSAQQTTSPKQVEGSYSAGSILESRRLTIEGVFLPSLNDPATSRTEWGSFKKAHAKGKSGRLYVNATRYVNCTVSSLTEAQITGSPQHAFSLEFKTTDDPYWHSTSEGSDSITPSGTSVSKVVTNNGTAPTGLLVFLEGITAGVLYSIQNTTNNTSSQYLAELSGNAVIDFENEKVEVDSAEDVNAYFDGVIWLEPGANTIVFATATMPSSIGLIWPVRYY